VDEACQSIDGLLQVFWRSIAPTDAWGQFAEKGSQYRTAIFYHDAAQKAAARASVEALEASGVFQLPARIDENIHAESRRRRDKGQLHDPISDHWATLSSCPPYESWGFNEIHET